MPAGKSQAPVQHSVSFETLREPPNPDSANMFLNIDSDDAAARQQAQRTTPSWFFAWFDDNLLCSAHKQSPQDTARRPEFAASGETPCSPTVASSSPWKHGEIPAVRRAAGNVASPERARPSAFCIPLRHQQIQSNTSGTPGLEDGRFGTNDFGIGHDTNRAQTATVNRSGVPRVLKTTAVGSRVQRVSEVVRASSAVSGASTVANFSGNVGKRGNSSSYVVFSESFSESGSARTGTDNTSQYSTRHTDECDPETSPHIILCDFVEIDPTTHRGRTICVV